MLSILVNNIRTKEIDERDSRLLEIVGLDEINDILIAR